LFHDRRFRSKVNYKKTKYEKSPNASLHAPNRVLQPGKPLLPALRLSLFQGQKAYLFNLFLLVKNALNIPFSC
jgi:hypothetical protein